MAKLIQPNLSGGEVSPAIAARVDFAKYKTSVKTALNVIVRTEGGLESRGGLQRVAQVKDSTAITRVIPFAFNVEQTYTLEFGDLYLRFMTNGGQILESSTETAISGATQADPCVLTITGHPFVDGDEIYIVDVVGMSQLNGRNFRVASATANTIELQDLFGVDIDATGYSAYSTGGAATRVYEIETPYSASEVFDVHYVQTADVMTLTHPDHAPMELVRVDNDNWTLTEIVYEPQQAAPTALSVTVNTAGTETDRYVVTAVNRESGEESLRAITASVVSITNITRANPAVVTATAHPLADGDEIAILAVSGMTEVNGRRFIVTNAGVNDFELYTVSGNPVDSSGFNAYSSGGTVHTAFDEVTNSNTTRDNTISWTAAAEAESYNIYRLDNGVYGFIGTTELTSFLDDNIAPDTGDTPPKIRDPFELGTNYYPSTVSYAEQRRIFANSNTFPQKFWMTQTANFYNFSVSSPTRDDDAITATLAARQVNEIRHILPTSGDLIFLTSGAEWLVSGVDDLITPSTIRVKPQSSYGSTTLRPISAESVGIFMQPGQIVRDLFYEFASDSYGGTDLSILARHLLDDYTIVDWGYAQSPRSVIWAVRSDGTMLTMTYAREQEVYGWTRHVTKGDVESVAVVRENDRDIPYFVIKRKIGGQYVKFIERLNPRDFTDVRDAMCLDAALSLDNPVTITGYTNANPIVVTAPSHNLQNGNTVDISDVLIVSTDPSTQGRELATVDEINANGFTVANVTANTFELSGIDGTGWGVYDSGGVVRRQVSTVGGLWHLEGETVSALVNGYVQTGLTVSSGTVTLAEAGSRIHIGIPYTCRVVPLPIYVETRAGSQADKIHKISRLSVRVEKTLGLWHGPDRDHMREHIFSQPSLYGQPPEMVTGTLQMTLKPDWKRDADYVIEQRDPLPMSILSLIPDATVGGN